MSIQYRRGQLNDIDSTLYDASLNNDGLIIRVSKTDNIAPPIIANKFALSCIVQGDGIVFTNTGTVAVPFWSSFITNGITPDLVVTGSLSAAEILTLFSAQTQILPPPGLGLAYLPTYTQARYNFGTAPYAVNPGSSIRLVIGTTVFSIYQNNQFLGSLSDQSIAGIVAGPGFLLQENTSMDFTATTGDPTLGDGTIDYEIHYKIITL